jgi:hypothetical protein
MYRPHVEALVAVALCAGPVGQAEAAPAKPPITPSLEQLANQAVAHAVDPYTGKEGPKTIKYDTGLAKGGVVSVIISSSRLENGLPDPDYISELEVSKYDATSYLGAAAIPVKSIRFSRNRGERWNAQESTMVYGLPDTSRRVEVIGREVVKESEQGVTEEGIMNYPVSKVTDEKKARAEFNRMERVAGKLLKLLTPSRREIR